MQIINDKELSTIAKHFEEDYEQLLRRYRPMLNNAILMPRIQRITQNLLGWYDNPYSGLDDKTAKAVINEIEDVKAHLNKIKWAGDWIEE